MVVAPESLAQLSEAQLRETLATLMQAMQRRDTELAFKQTVIDKLTHENAVLKRLKFAAQSERYNAEQRSSSHAQQLGVVGSTGCAAIAQSVCSGFLPRDQHPALG